MSFKRKLSAFLVCTMLLSLFTAYPVISATAAETLSSAVYYIDSDKALVYDVLPGTTVIALVGNFNNDEAALTVYDAKGNVMSDSDYIATGCTLSCDGDSAALVVKGDLNGDGSATSADLVVMRMYISRAAALSDAFLAAADMDYDDTITSTDYTLFRAHFLNDINIYDSTHPLTPLAAMYEVTFTAGTGGSLSGDASAVVSEGTAFSAITVPTPVADAGYVFTGWTPAFPTKITSDLAFTANFTKTAVSTKQNYASAELGGQYMFTYGALFDTEDEFEVTEEYGSGMLNDGTRFTASEDDWLEVSRSSSQIVVVVMLAETVSVTEAVLNVGLLENSGNRVLPDSVHVYTATEDGPDTYFGTDSSYTAIGDYGYIASVSGSAEDVKYVKFVCEMSGYIGRFGEVEVYGVSGSSATTQYTVSFSAGSNGSLSGKTAYTVDSGTLWSTVTVPTPVAAAGYKFTGWSPALPDSSSAIVANANYTAQFEYDSTQYATVNFVAGANGSISGSTSFTVLKGTAWSTIAVPTTTANAGYKFDSWSPSFPSTVSSDATYTANFVYDASQYATVKFVAGANGSISGTTEFTVLKGTSFDDITVPTATGNSGYKFDSWSPILPSTVTADATYTATFAVDNSQYATVTFVSAANGKISGTTSYTVLKGTSWSEITVPTATANTGYKFVGWTPTFPAAITESATYTANFAVDDGQYATIMFVAGSNGSLSGETSVTVLKGTAWSEIKVPDTVAVAGYKFDSWSPSFPSTVTEDATYTANFVYDASQYASIIFVADENGTLEGTTEFTLLIGSFMSDITVPTPVADAGYKFDSWSPALSSTVTGDEIYIASFIYDATQYATVTFVAGSNGSISGTSSYTVLKGTAWTEITVPAYTADAGYKFDSWSPSFPTTITTDATYTANFVYDSTQYATVKFVAGSNGSISGTTSYTVLKGTAWTEITVPTTTANAGYMFDSWSPSFPSTITANATYTANFVYDESQFVNVKFLAGANGTLSGTASYTVLIGTAWSSITVPTPVANSGYKFNAWDVAFPSTITTDATFTALFEAIPVYTVAFVAGSNGTISGTWYFDVQEGSLWGDAITVPTPVANAGYTFSGWSPSLPADSTSIASDLTYTALFVAETSSAYRENYAASVNGGTYAYVTGSRLDGYNDPNFTEVYSESTGGWSSTTYSFGNGYLNNNAQVFLNEGQWVEVARGSTSGFQAQSNVVVLIVRLDSAKSDIEQVVVNLGTHATSSNRGLPDTVTVKYTTRSSLSSFMNWSTMGSTSTFEHISGYGYKAVIENSASSSIKYLQITLSMSSYYAARIGEIEVLGPETNTVVRNVAFTAGTGGSLSGTTSYSVADGSSWSSITVPTPVANDGYKFSHWSPPLPASTSTITADAAYTAVFTERTGSEVENFALSTNGGSYMITQGTVQTGYPDSFDSNSAYGSGYLNDGNWLNADADSWVEVSRSSDTIGVTFKLSENINMSSAVMNFGLRDGSSNRVLPDSVTVYVGSSASDITTLFGTSSNFVATGDFGYSLTIDGSAENVSYVYFECAMSNYIGRLGEFEIYGSVGEVVPTYTVSFNADTNGTVSGSTYQTVTEGTLWSEIEIPTATANAGYVFTGWTPAFPADDEAITENLSFTANFEYDASLWSTVTFVAGTGGSLSGTTVVSVPTGSAWSSITVPTVVTNDGYTFTGWTPSFPSTVTATATYTANFIVTPADQYVITFLAGDGGTLSGTTTFTVDEGTLWSEIIVPTPIANSGYVFSTWTPELPDSTTAIGDNATYTANFVKDTGATLEGVIYINGVNASQYISGGSHIYTISYGSAFTATYWEVYVAGYSEAKGGYIVTEIYESSATKSVEVPANGILIAVHMGSQTQAACDYVDVGDLLVLTDDINLSNATCVAGSSYVSIYTGDGTLPDDDSGSSEEPDPPVNPSEYQQINYSNVKGMWLSQFDLNSVFISGSAQRSEASFRALMGTILDNCVSNHINTLFVQVRPNGDSMYPSEYYTMSKYVVGTYGKTATYDPFAIIIELAHARNLSVQAWINPLRLMSSTDIAKVSTEFKVGEWYQSSTYNGKYVVLYGSYYYLNPAYEEVRQLIIDGAAEICNLYNVDGVHMDDYFYPTTDSSFDSTAYNAYTGSLSLANWRRQNLNLLVSGIYSAVKAVDKDILFGISPAGNMSTVYSSQYADVYTWCSTSGYIDYICPQVYFGMLHSTQAFDTCSSGWANIVTSSSVTLYAGITLGKALEGYNGTTDAYAGTTEGKYEWVNNRDVVKSCLEYVRDTLVNKGCTGVVFFCYQYFYEPTTGTSVVETAEERANFLPVLEALWPNTTLLSNQE